MGNALVKMREIVQGDMAKVYGIGEGANKEEEKKEEEDNVVNVNSESIEMKSVVDEDIVAEYESMELDYQQITDEYEEADGLPNITEKVKRFIGIDERYYILMREIHASGIMAASSKHRLCASDLIAQNPAPAN